MKKTNYFLLLLFSLLLTNLGAQKGFFEVITNKNLPKPVEAVQNIKKMNIIRLNETALRQYLSGAPMEFLENSAALPLEIPLPDGTIETFELLESPNLAPEIAAQYPDIKTYAGNGQKHKEYAIRINLTSLGLSAILLDGTGGAIYFEHYSTADPNLYFSYFTKDAIAPPSHLRARCDFDHQHDLHKEKPDSHGDHDKSTGSTLRTFRLAMAANAEFTAEFGGGTAAGGLAAVTNYVNTINAIYRQELSIHFNLVSGTNLIYTNAGTDPYSNDTGPMIDENRTNVDAVIGSANYDIAHVLGYDVNFGSGGGLAYAGVVCEDGYKGGGASVIGSGYGQVFYDQLILHEMGHQFGMSHSYNSVIPVCTTRNPATSVEPGAGATIMSYGFTCGSDDYFSSSQMGPILIFHTISYSQAETYIASAGGCFSATATGNAVPVITMPNNYTIPKSTPFALTGSADTPGNGDNYTYCWEGTNIGTSTPNAGTLANTAEPPFFRTYAPSSSPTRTFPLLSAILDGSNYAKGDKLPSVGIATTHRLTVRDNNAAGGGLDFGEVTVTVDGNIGPFLETTNLAGSYAANTTQTITWSVNGTDNATPNVKISLSTDGGMTFPIELVASTANDGSEDITIPNNPTSTARIKVEAIGNIFFDISNADFTITPGEMVSCPVDFSVCPDAPAFALTGATPVGGSYTGSGVSGNMFDASDAGLGMHTITYTTGGGSCMFVITVEESAPGGITYYQDSDSDGFGNPAVSQQACVQPIGYVANNTDCDDTDPLEKPGQTWYADLDGDNYSSGVTLTQCLRPMGYKVATELTATSGDCNDNDPAINPGATEVCDGIDNNCNNSTDEGVTTTWYRDMDGDSFGNPNDSQEACSKPAGYVANNTDCDDTDPLEKPGQTWYADLDGDNYSSGATLTQCLRPMGYKVAAELTATSGDCDDNDPAINPEAVEVQDGVDNNCNDQIDESTLPAGWSDFGDDGIGCVGGNDVEYDPGTESFNLESAGCYSTNWTADDAAYVKYDLCGDGEIIAHLTALSPIGQGWAGITIRESEAPGAKKVSLAVNFSNFVRREIRTTTNGYSVPQQLYRPGVSWLKLTRTGNFFIGQVSFDAINWQTILYSNLPMNECAQFGLFLTNTNGMTVNASFDNVTVTSGNDNLGLEQLPTINTDASQSQFAQQNLTIMPNPTRGDLYVDLSQFEGQDAVIEILNRLGQKTQEYRIKEVQSGFEKIDLNGLDNGAYFIRVTSDRGQITNRFVLAK